MITVHKQLTDNVKARISCSNMHGSEAPTGLGEIEDDKFRATFRVHGYKDDPALRLVCFEGDMMYASHSRFARESKSRTEAHRNFLARLEAIGGDGLPLWRTMYDEALALYEDRNAQRQRKDEVTEIARLTASQDNMVWFLSKCGGTLDAEVVKRGIFGSPLYQGFGLSESLPYTKEQAKEMFASKFSTQRLVEGVESAQKRIATLHDYIRAADALMVTLQATGVADCFETYWEEVEKAYYQFKEKPEL
jgi:hypothetical protein